MSRPLGLSAGGFGLVLAWFGGFAIARLTGATPVVIVLAVGLVAFLLAAIAGYLAVRRVAILAVKAPPLSTQGEDVKIVVELTSPRPVWLDIRSDGRLVSAGSAEGGMFVGLGSFDRRGAVRVLEVGIRSAGAPGLVWWVRRVRVEIDEHLVAPRRRDGEALRERSSDRADGELFGSPGAIAGEIDGIRPWRDGDSEKYVHWSSTLRSGELVVHDRRRDVDPRWLVRARPSTPAPDFEAGVVRRTLELALGTGSAVQVALGDGDPTPIADGDTAARWTALADLGPQPAENPGARGRSKRIEPVTAVPAAGRWWAAAATFLSLAMLETALGSGSLAIGLVALSVGAGAVVSTRAMAAGGHVPQIVRGLVGTGALVALVVVVMMTGRFGGLLGLLRGPLPHVLVILVLLHGFECCDRRTIRVGLAVSAVVLMYASALRVDASIAWWMLGWAICVAAAIAKLAGPPRRKAVSVSATAWAGRFAWGGATLALTFGLLAFVPVPDGPARLTMPTIIDDHLDVREPGAIAAPDGSIQTPSDDDDGGERAPAGQAGGYAGFAQSMDTSVRGALSSEIVMRVRAPAPDFWRGQTFGSFDGRRWYADDQIGTLREGPSIDVPAALGDLPVVGDVQVDRFVQTYYVEADLPNVIFHANRPERVILDADVWTRGDGAIRASTVLTEGAIYTVVSRRPRVDEGILRRQGLVGRRLSDLGRRVLGKYVELPASTTPETIALADQLAAGQDSTYDVIRSFEAWMASNVEYDLDAPVPDPGEDAVHDFLFDTRLGFCEQIASALTIMLRTQGVPARVATGYASGSRDRIAGVYEVRASDAHAWVEVWFPETGWQAFDPTASVPLSADAGIQSIGVDLAAGVGGYVGDRLAALVLILALGLGSGSALGVARALNHRRRRGRWGLLQDRFRAAAVRRGAREGSPNPQLAAAWTDPDVGRGSRKSTAGAVAERLDRAAFDPSFADDDGYYDETREMVGSLRSDRR